MKNLLTITTTLLFVSASLFGAAQPTVAVLPFIPQKEGAATAEILRESLVSELVRTGKTVVVEREAIGKILKEQSFQQSGAAETEQAVKLGKILSVHYVVTGSVREMEKTLIWTIQVLHVESARIVASERVDGALARQLLGQSRKLSGKITDAIRGSQLETVVSLPAVTNRPGGAGERSPEPDTNTRYTPFQLGFVGPIQLFPKHYSVTGLSVSVISSENRAVRGLDAGLILIASDLMVGVQAGLLNFTDELWGVQAGLINKAGDIRAVQAGLINIARVVRGVQVGLINVTERLYGVQVGLINVASRGPGVPFMIAINIGF